MTIVDRSEDVRGTFIERSVGVVASTAEISVERAIIRDGPLVASRAIISKT